LKAVYLENPNVIRMTELPYPDSKPNQAIIKVKAASICGSDVGAFRGQNVLVTYPRILGHEVAGEIVEIGPNDQGLVIGDHVILDPYVYCGKCYPCSIGRTNCCENLEVLGVHRDGGMAEFFSHPDHLLHKVPEDMAWELVPLAEPLTISLHSLHRAGTKAGEFVTIIGAGPIGLMAALVAIHYKATPILVDVLDARLDYAQSLGIRHVINPLKSDVAAKIRAITEGTMSHAVIEASGSNQAIRATLDYVSFAGRIVFTGWPKAETELPTALITKKELDIRGSRTSAGEFQEAIELIYQNQVDVKAVVSKSVAFEALAEAVADQSAEPEKYLKIISVF
jgi:2-desacetyl-2-hydroxyethyl bacteriochlorophyllide A dehydrogenase